MVSFDDGMIYVSRRAVCGKLDTHISSVLSLCSTVLLQTAMLVRDGIGLRVLPSKLLQSCHLWNKVAL